RTQLAIEEARKDPPKVVAGDARDALPRAVAESPSGSTTCVLTSWSFSYFSVEARDAFIRLLGDLARERSLAWLYADGPGVYLGFDGFMDECVMGVVWFDRGVPRPELLAIVQPHGDWLDWRADAARR